MTAILVIDAVACTVGDWVQVECDYSPGMCSEGGTGVVIAKEEGKRESPARTGNKCLTYQIAR